jgi:hypothetical protein
MAPARLPLRWSDLCSMLASKGLRLQFTEDAEAFTMFALDGAIEYEATIYKGAVPDGVISIYSQGQNDADRADFEANYRDDANQTVDPKPALEPDRRMVVVNFPADEGSFMWICGRGDDLETSTRGTGQKIEVKFADVQRTEFEEQSIEVGFLEQVQLHDGQLFIRNANEWSDDDEWDFGIVMHATEATPNQGNTGNANIVNGYVVVPANGDGSHDVDFDAAVPVPADGDGFWDYNPFLDLLSPASKPGSAGYHALLVPVVAYFMRSIPIPFHAHTVFDFDAYKAERIMPRWRLRLTVRRKQSGPGTLAGWLVVFREKVT